MSNCITQPNHSGLYNVTHILVLSYSIYSKRINFRVFKISWIDQEHDKF